MTSRVTCRGPMACCCMIIYDIGHTGNPDTQVLHPSNPEKSGLEKNCLDVASINDTDLAQFVSLLDSSILGLIL